MDQAIPFPFREIRLAFFTATAELSSYAAKWPGGGGSHIKVTGVIVVLLGVKIRGLVPLGVLKSKMTSVRDMALSLRGKKLFGSRPQIQNRILVPFRTEFFSKFPTITPVTFVWESPPPPPLGLNGSGDKTVRLPEQ